MLPILSGCSRLFGPGLSCHDTDYFAEPPIIVHYDDHYAFRWKYGTQGYFFEPHYQIRDGVLVFSLQSTSSTGDLADKVSEITISRYDEIMAIKRGGARWWSASDGVTEIPVIEEHAPDATSPSEDTPASDMPPPVEPEGVPVEQKPDEAAPSSVPAAEAAPVSS